MNLVPNPSTSNQSSMSRKLTFHEFPGAVARQFFLYRPSTELAGAPLVVSVHGIARNAAAHAYRLMAEAERYGLVVVAPLFNKPLYGQYQQLEDARTRARSDLAMLDILEAAARLSDADVAQVLLFGYSGGAQFAHRFAMAYPERVRSAVLAAAGWYTFPDEDAPYPQGLDTRPIGADLHFNRRSFTRVRYHVMVGQLDTARDNSLRCSKRLDHVQGHNRIERAASWVSAMSQLPFEEQGQAPPSFLMLPKVGHSFTDAVEKADLPKRVFDRFAVDAALAPLAGFEGEEHV